jgi:hypothetical protein
VWVEYPDIKSASLALGAPPTGQMDGQDLYTLPTIRNPATGEVVTDSFAIARYLDAKVRMHTGHVVCSAPLLALNVRTSVPRAATYVRPRRRAFQCVRRSRRHAAQECAPRPASRHSGVSPLTRVHA